MIDVGVAGPRRQPRPLPRRPRARGRRAPERRPAARLPGRRGGGRRAPDRLRRLELRGRRDRRGRAAGCVPADLRPAARRARASRAGLARDDPGRGRGRPRRRPRGDHGARRTAPSRERRSSTCSRSATRCSTSRRRSTASTCSRWSASRARSPRSSVASSIRPSPTIPPSSTPRTVDVTIEDFDGCPRYIGRVFRDVAIGPSPQWLRSRLFLADMRSISNVVDVTNYVMHVWGSPLHAFDRTKLAGGRIVVRRARAGEELRTLDGTLRRLEAGRPAHHRRRAGRRARGDHGRRGQRGHGDTTRGAARGGELRAARDPAHVRAARAAHGRVEPLGEGRRPVPRRERRRSREPPARRSRRSADDGPRRRPRRAPGAPGRPLPPRARVAPDRTRRAPRRAARDASRASGSTSPTTGTSPFRPGARAT